MIHEEEKIAKILEELTMYFFALGATHITSGIVKEEGQTVITFRGNYHPDNKDKLSCIEKYLNEPKNDGIEDIYWELAGSGDPGETSQLLLVGMMIDRAEIEFEEQYLSLKVYRKNKG